MHICRMIRKFFLLLVVLFTIENMLRTRPRRIMSALNPNKGPYSLSAHCQQAIVTHLRMELPDELRGLNQNSNFGVKTWRRCHSSSPSKFQIINTASNADCSIRMSFSPREDRVVRHSGRAHIRGKIRRIWRPRYLELLDNGFVRYYECEHDDEQQSIETPELATAMVPKCTLRVYRARIIDVTTLRDVHVGLPRGVYGFLFHAQRLPSFNASDADMHCNGVVVHDSQEPRDFLCSVPSLEEAQSWVVALQWASTLNPRESTDGYHSSCITNNDDLFSTDLTPRKPTRIVMHDHVSEQKKHETRTTTPKAGKIVLPKVQQVFPVRTKSPSIQIAYRIQLLLLQQKSGTSVEERVVLRTWRDLDALLDQLAGEMGRDKTIQNLKRRFLKVRHPESYRQHVEAIALVNSILRSLAMDVHICNSNSLRKFWSLDDFVVQSSFLDVHHVNSIQRQVVYEIAAGGTDAFCRKWVQSGRQEKVSIMKECIYYVLQRPVLFGGAFVAPVLFLKPFLWLRRSVMISFHVPMDVLVISWLGIWFAGREWERQFGKRRVIRVKQPARTTATAEEDSLDAIDDSEASCCEVDDHTNDDPGELYDDDLSIGVVPSKRSTKKLSSPLPKYPDNGAVSCWSKPPDNIFRVRSPTYLQDRVKMPSAPAPFTCRGVDFWFTDNPERHIARHPSVMGGRLEDEDTFLVNFLLPFGNFVSYFSIPPLDRFPGKLADVWTKFIHGDQQYRDARLKLLPVVVDGPWIVKAAVGPGTSPALLGKVIPLQYYFRHPTASTKGIYEVDVIITASTIAKGILSVVKGHTNALTIAFGFIIEAAKEEELPETVLCNFQIHSLNLDDCPQLPHYDMDQDKMMTRVEGAPPTDVRRSGN